jgi:hypothetical protein
MLEKTLKIINRCKNGIEIIKKEPNTEKIKAYKNIIINLLEEVEVYALLLIDTYTKISLYKVLKDINHSNIDKSIKKIEELIKSNDNPIDIKNKLAGGIICNK